MLQEILNITTGQVWYLACIVGALTWGTAVGLNWNSRKRNRWSDSDLIWCGFVMGVVAGFVTLMLVFHTTSVGAFCVLLLIAGGLGFGIPYMQKRKENKRAGLSK
ncbi:hypothetical protein VPHD148_0141 [Vibrio phage D148]